jgi:hypothetical protein
MDELKTEPEFEDAIHGESERLGIRHIMYWMVGIAVAMGVLQVRARLNDQTVSGIAIVGQLAFAGAYGLGLAGLMVCLRRLRRKQILLRHPGYGWLFLMGIAAAIDLGTNPSLLWIHSALFPVASGSHDLSSWYLDSSRVVFGWLIGAAVAILFCFRKSNGWSWRLSFAAMGIYAIRAALGALIPMLVMIQNSRPGSWLWQGSLIVQSDRLHLSLAAGVVAIMLLAIVADLVKHRSRDWLHWCGVIPWWLLAGLVSYDLAT